MKFKHTNNGFYLFHCPGCNRTHYVDKNIWQFNGDVDNPTVSPSILVNGYEKCINPTEPRCHSFIKDGKIQFLSDCSHSLAGQTVELPEWEEF